ncbi:MULTISPECIES: small secreted protein [unclassified Streptomyces]|uniref:small secreted protein n=1 Tax=unclassified Streptomyces TaxID=2593676 RepID=UPI002E0E3559|nr:small secreted protein [Streptomyces sp. NBC_01207]WTA19459.1 small secreted protein [Streptomyces sp. NBC_00853]
MNKKIAAALSGGAALMLVLSGCGGGDDTDQKASSWAKKVCDQWQPQIEKIEAANVEIKRVASESSKPDEVQKTDSTAFATMTESYKAMADALRSAGVPPVKNGSATQEAAAKGFETTSTGYADLKAKTDALDPQDKTKFADGLKEVAGGLKDVTKGGQDALAQLKAGGLGPAINSQKGCQVAAAPASGQ